MQLLPKAMPNKMSMKLKGMQVWNSQVCACKLCQRPNKMSIELKGMQVWNEEDAEDEVLAMVVRTGLCTSMGSMMRQVVHNGMPTRNLLLRVSRKNWGTMSVASLHEHNILLGSMGLRSRPAMAVGLLHLLCWVSGPPTGALLPLHCKGQGVRG